MNLIASNLRKNEPSELLKACAAWRIWYFLSKLDILQRYRGSVLGPFWITISTAVTVFSMGYLYGILFGLDRATYLPYFATGMIIWNFIAMIVNESTKIFQESKSYMENIKVSCIVYIFRLVFRNLIILAHNLPVYICIAIIYKMDVNRNIFLLIPGILALCLNGIFYGTIFAFISARFPDMGSMIASILQVIFFITPIMWAPSNLPEKLHLFLYINPFYYFVSLVRNPLLGHPYSFHEVIGTLVVTALGFALFMLVFNKYSKRVVFWI